MNKRPPVTYEKGKNPLVRVIKKLFGYYPVLAPLTMACILFSSIVSAIPSLFIQNILAVVEKWYRDGNWAAARAEILPYITLLIVLYVLSILSMVTYSQLMAYMTQGFLNKLRIVCYHNIYIETFCILSKTKIMPKLYKNNKDIF